MVAVSIHEVVIALRGGANGGGEGVKVHGYHPAIPCLRA
jgi:hypothetical protein